jgi:hypothetical protein
MDMTARTAGTVHVPGGIGIQKHAQHAGVNCGVTPPPSQKLHVTESSTVLVLSALWILPPKPRLLSCDELNDTELHVTERDSVLVGFWRQPWCGLCTMDSATKP